MRADRAARRALEAALAVDLRVYVLCPLRRERTQQLYTGTRSEFIRIGVQCCSIVRLEGCDVMSDRLPRRCAEMCPPIARRGRRAVPSEIVSVSLFHAFATRAGRYLAGSNGKRVALFCEDDCRFHPYVTARDIARVAAEAGARVGWLGYRMGSGQPRYGANFVTFTEAALAAFMEQAPAFLLRRIFALDTLLHLMWREGHVWLPPSSLAFQHAHAVRGRQ